MQERGRVRTRTKIPDSQSRALFLYTNGFMKTKFALTLPHLYMYIEFLKRYTRKLTVLTSGQYDTGGGQRSEEGNFYFVP